MTRRDSDAQRDGGAEDPTSLALPNVVASLFPLYWICVLAWRWVTELIPYVSRKRPRATVLLDGLQFVEAPRMQRGLLYFSNMFGRAVHAYDFTSRRIVKTLDFPGLVSGLGWTRDGQLLVVMMKERKIVLYDEATGTARDYADVSAASRFRCNEMCVDARGRAYVGNFGFNLERLWEFRATSLALVTAKGVGDSDTDVRVVARDMLFPNGTVVTPDGGTLIVAETFAGHLSAFDIAADGTLSRRRVWAYVGLPLDGICLDARGRIWAAAPQIGATRLRGGILRISEGGHIDTVLGFGANNIDRNVIACMLRTNPNDGSHQLILALAHSFTDHRIQELGRDNALVAVIDVDTGPALMPDESRYCAGYC